MNKDYACGRGHAEGKETMKTIALVNQKGGVGKTATAVQLAAGLKRAGKRVLCVDLDPQANFSRTLYGKRDAPLSVYEVLVGGKGVHEAAVETFGGDTLLSARGNKLLSNIDAVVGNDPDKPYLLQMALEEVEGDYDYAVIDTPGVRDTLAYNALVASSGIVVPAMGDEYSLEGIDQLADSVTRVRRRSNKGLEIYGVLVTIFRKGTCYARDMATNIEATARRLGTSSFSSHIRESVLIPESLASGQSIFDYSGTSPVAGDYEGFVNELVARIENGAHDGQ